MGCVFVRRILNSGRLDELYAICARVYKALFPVHTPCFLHLHVPSSPTPSVCLPNHFPSCVLVFPCALCSRPSGLYQGCQQKHGWGAVHWSPRTSTVATLLKRTPPPSPPAFNCQQLPGRAAASWALQHLQISLSIWSDFIRSHWKSARSFESL